MTTDVRGNEFTGQIDIIGAALGNVNDPRVSVLSLAAANAVAQVDLNGQAITMIDVRGTFVGTLVFEGMVGGSTWLTLNAFNVATRTFVGSTTTVGQFALNSAGYRSIRVRMSVRSSGAADVAMRASIAQLSTIADALPATQGLTLTAAAGAVATLTIPAPGAGLFQHVNWILIEHFAAALGVAAALPTIVTTTNIPGNPSFNFRADAFAQGSMQEKLIQGGAMPIRASAANAAITVVAPATTSVLWRISASWRVAP